MHRSLIRSIARWLIAALLGVQFALAAYACPALDAAVSASQEQQVQAAGSMPAMAECGDALGAADSTLPNLCAAHCESDRQGNQTAQVGVPAAVAVALYDIEPPRRFAVLVRPAAASPSALVAAAPPHAILHCVRRT